MPTAAWPLPHRSVSNAAYLEAGPSFDRRPSTDWRIEPTDPTGEETYRPAFTSPVVANGRLVTINVLRFGTNVERPERHFVRAYDVATGDLDWELKVPHGSAPNPPDGLAVDDGTVLVAHDRTLRGLQMETGTEAWARTFDHRLHAVSPDRERRYLRAHRAVVAVDDEGESVWSRPFGAFPGALARGETNLYVGSSRRLVALDPETGAVRWRRALPAIDGGYGIAHLMAVRGGVVALQHSGDLRAIDATGGLVWEVVDDYRSLATDGARVYAGTAHSVEALDVTDGATVWATTCDDLGGCTGANAVVRPVVTDRTVYAATPSGGLFALRSDDGSQRWGLQLTAPLERLSLTAEALLGLVSAAGPIVGLRT